MATRLDRLLLLLETGSTPVIRKSAAEQLGEVQKLHPHELNNLLVKVHKYLRGSSWDTRIAASQAVDAITRNVPQWQPRGAPKTESLECDLADGRLSFKNFDVHKVLQSGVLLLGSEGIEYSEEDWKGVDIRDQLAQQKQMLNKRLGLNIAGGMGVNTDDLYKDEDLEIKYEDNKHSFENQTSVSELLNEQSSFGNKPSAREKNRAKRKAKLMAKQISREVSHDDKYNGDENDAPNKKPRVSPDLSTDSNSDILDMGEGDEWPFEMFCELLLADLFHTSWVYRHGAARGLREIIKNHGRGAGKNQDVPANHLEEHNQQWLVDVSLRLVCVLALDRFGDFVSDEVVAPVRETSAQTLGVLLQCMNSENVEGVLSVLLQLLNESSWEVRHGGMLGIKYLLAVRQDLCKSFLSSVLPFVFNGLKDADDDVRAVAAATLVPIVNDLISILPQQISNIINSLWTTLQDLDDLTSSTNSIMNLLSALLKSSQETCSQCATDTSTFSTLIPRLWPFLRHNNVSVRKATLETFHTVLLNTDKQVDHSAWLVPILQDALRHIFQCSLLENQDEVLAIIPKVWSAILLRAPIEYLVAATSPWVGAWLCLVMQPSKVPFDQNLLIQAKHVVKEHHSKGRHLPAEVNTENHDYIGGYESLNSDSSIRDHCVVRARITASCLLGNLCHYFTKAIPNFPDGAESPLEAIAKLLNFHLCSKSAVQRFVISLTIQEWCNIQKDLLTLIPEYLKLKLLECLQEAIYFDEIAMLFTRMQSECRDFIDSLRQQKIDIDAIFNAGSVLTMEQANNLCSTIYDSVRTQLKPRQQQYLDDRRTQLLSIISQTNSEQLMLSTRVLAYLAGVCVSLGAMPEKLNPVIRPLMESIKKEENSQLQIRAANHLSHLLDICLLRATNPCVKILKNLCTALCCDKSYTPSAVTPTQNPSDSDENSSNITCDKYTGILTLSTLQQKIPESKRSRTMKKFPVPIAEFAIDSSIETSSELQKQNFIQRRGATLALTTIVQHFGSDLREKLPCIWQTMSEKLLGSKEKDLSEYRDNDEFAQELINSLQVLEIISPTINTALTNQLMELLGILGKCLSHPYTSVRHMSARCIGVLCKISSVYVMNHILETLLPSVGASDDYITRQGVIEALHCIIEQLQFTIVPYTVLLVVPLLGRMSDQNMQVRLMATQCFATLIRLLPLEAGSIDPPDMKECLIEKREQERHFLEQLMDISKLDDFKMPVKINAELRKYQQDGVNWLWFLNRYKLHGILCDDMGLGKTLMSICILAGDHYNREIKYKESKSPDSQPLPSIVVCPPTLAGHWLYEVEKFVSKDQLNPLCYMGPPLERQKLREQFDDHNLIIASYDIVRNDIDFFRSKNWNYCILDEGHIIKNGKTKLSKAVKTLNTNHRLILSGTPIQNNVLELWSLFDFLLPGFLGTERQFNGCYGKPILQSREAKSSSKEQEAGVLAMEALHRQVLPFLLRRLKEDVLQDLPPKIIQDYYCDMSPLQQRLYEDFAESNMNGIEDQLKQESSSNEETTHIFQALQYLKKVCNHPSLVLNSCHPKYDEVITSLPKGIESLKDIQHACKLPALKQLLLDCGIGGSCSNQSGDELVVSPHRALIFCQLKSMLDIVETHLFKAEMPQVSYLRLDGSIPAVSRYPIVTKFNNDPSIDVLLLTTHVGGLGLNLTGADTVIFMEHDWNPMKDLQAMDRAHRIGQKKVVNVYRLITRGTLEEKIMGLQKFKLTIANTVISQENSSLQSMGTDQLLDLFAVSDKPGSTPAAKSDDRKYSANRTVISGLQELWDEQEYKEEYDLDNFLTGLKPKQ
ncbi:TATA-binding protein-associated factor 172-like [Tubulanus polymorphus]|uniref:TATA-binding protein-associated factor 172-like n=1 Tax=Tubulanus polymorphus TaxID=672921 RepID=UPI003DA1E646